MTKGISVGMRSDVAGSLCFEGVGGMGKVDSDSSSDSVWIEGRISMIGEGVCLFLLCVCEKAWEKWEESKEGRKKTKRIGNGTGWRDILLALSQSFDRTQRVLLSLYGLDLQLPLLS